MKGLGIIATLGLFIAIVPNMGLYGYMRDTIIFALGILVFLIAIIIRFKSKIRISGDSKVVDHKPYLQNDITEIKSDDK